MCVSLPTQALLALASKQGGMDCCCTRHTSTLKIYHIPTSHSVCVSLHTQALLALASKQEGMDCLLHSPPTLQRLTATLQMAQVDASLPKLALQVRLFLMNREG